MATQKPDRISPYNDLPYGARLWTVDVVTRKKTPYTEDDVRAYLTGTPDPASDPPDPDLVWDCDPPNDVSSEYLVNLPGDDLTPDKLEAVVVGGKTYLVIESETSRSIRLVAVLTYELNKYVVPT